MCMSVNLIHSTGNNVETNFGKRIANDSTSFSNSGMREICTILLLSKHLKFLDENFRHHQIFGNSTFGKEFV